MTEFRSGSSNSRIFNPPDFRPSASSSAQSLKPSDPRTSKNLLKSIVSNVSLKSDSLLAEKRSLVTMIEQRRPSTQYQQTSKMNRSTLDDRVMSPEGSPERRNNLSVSFFQIQQSSLKNQLRSSTSDAKENISKTLSTSLMSTSPIKYSGRSKPNENLSRRIEEKFIAEEVARHVTKESYDCKEQRKKIESQVSALETRIAKLKYEEDEVMKRVQKVREDTEKALENKKRRQEDILLKEQFYKQREAEMKKRREKVVNNKHAGQTNLRQAKTNNLESKYSTALSVKMDNNNYKSIKETIDRQTNDKNRMLIRRVSEQHENVKAKKLQREISGMNKFTEKHVNQITEDREITDKLARRYQELVDYEQEMLEKLGRTYELHKSQVSDFEQVSTMRIETNSEESSKLFKSKKV